MLQERQWLGAGGVERLGIWLSNTLPTKAQGEAWAVAEEAAILSGKRTQFPRRTLREAVKRYQVEVTDKKAEKKPKVAKADNLRFEAWLRDYPDLASKVFCEITGDDLATWRDGHDGRAAALTWLSKRYDAGQDQRSQGHTAAL